jgi:hypothetical protein
VEEWDWVSENNNYYKTDFWEAGKIKAVLGGKEIKITSIMFLQYLGLLLSFQK